MWKWFLHRFCRWWQFVQVYHNHVIFRWGRLLILSRLRRHDCWRSPGYRLGSLCTSLKWRHSNTSPYQGSERQMQNRVREMRWGLVMSAVHNWGMRLLSNWSTWINRFWHEGLLYPEKSNKEYFLRFSFFLFGKNEIMLLTCEKNERGMILFLSRGKFSYHR